jgi:peptidoglycan/xylan/chitin deacetylase (PgdA/CDA1 family)
MRSRSAGTLWLRPLLTGLSPAGSRGFLTTLIFHRVHLRPDPLFPLEMDASAFRDRIHWVRQLFNVMDLQEAVVALSRGKLPSRALAITFDDGYADNCSVAMPLLREAGLTATFFVAAGFLDGGCMWNDVIIESVRRANGTCLDLTRAGFRTHDISSTDARRGLIAMLLSNLKYQPPEERAQRVSDVALAAHLELPRNLMMTGGQVRELAAAGMRIGAHTKSHPILACLDDAAARHEMSIGRELLEGIVREPVSLFAYPNGKPGRDYKAAHVRMARELRFAAAFSTASGAARAGGDLYQLPRFTPWDRTAPRWTARLVRNLWVHPDRVTA